MVDHAKKLELVTKRNRSWTRREIDTSPTFRILAYWRAISECVCSNPLPNGGCLRCDLDKIFNTQKQ